MSVTSKVTSKEKNILPISHKTTSSKKLNKNIISNIPLHVITDPIAPNKISKKLTKNLTIKSAIKAGTLFFATVGTYYIAKTTGVFSYLWGAKNPNTNINSKDLMEVKNEGNSLSVTTNLERKGQASNVFTTRSLQSYSNDKVVDFAGLPHLNLLNHKCLKRHFESF